MHGFSRAEDAEAYMVTTDEVFGGRSRASLRVKEYRYFAAGVFEGVVEWASEDRESRGGFCNVRLRERVRLADQQPGLLETEGVQLRVKTDGRPVLVNFQCSDATDEDVWQAEARTAPGRWETLALPWSGFAHVSRGLVRETQRGLRPEKINGFGLTVADGRNGPFRCELQWVLAMLDWDDTAWGGPRRATSAVMTEEEAWAAAEDAAERRDTMMGALRGPRTGETADGRRVTPYAMTDDQRSRWRNARGREGRRQVSEEIAAAGERE